MAPACSLYSELAPRSPRAAPRVSQLRAASRGQPAAGSSGSPRTVTGYVKILLRILAYARPPLAYLAGALVVMTAEAAVRTAPAWFSAVVIDRAAADGTLVPLPGRPGLLRRLRRRLALAAVQNYCTEWLGQSVVHDLRNSLYRHLQSKSMSFYDANQTGQLMSRVTNDVSQVQPFVPSGVVRTWTVVREHRHLPGGDAPPGRPADPGGPPAAPVIFLTQLRVRRTGGRTARCSA